jgi:hypothetical protein
MKKLLALLLIIIFCFGVFVSCNDEVPSESSSSEEEVPVSVKNRRTGEKVVLTGSEAELVEEILNPETFLENDYCDCIKYYEFRFGNYRVRYDEGRAEDMAVVRSKELSEEEMAQIDAIIEKYFGETLE